MDNDRSLEDNLKAALPEHLHRTIPFLTQVLVAARDGRDASVDTEDLRAALLALQGHTFAAQGGDIIVGNISGEGIAIGHGAQSTVIRIYLAHSPEQKLALRNRSRMLEKVQAQ